MLSGGEKPENATRDMVSVSSQHHVLQGSEKIKGKGKGGEGRRAIPFLKVRG